MDENTGFLASDAKSFDNLIASVNSNWTNLKDKEGATLRVYSCNSATGGKGFRSLVEKISAAHPNLTVIGVEGYCVYGQTWYGSYAITGIDVQSKSGLNDGYLVTYRNGKQIARNRLNN